MSERGPACLVLLFSDKAGTKHFGCQQPQFGDLYCCDAEYFWPVDHEDMPDFRLGSGEAAMLQSGGGMFSKVVQKKPGQPGTGRFKVAENLPVPVADDCIRPTATNHGLSGGEKS